MKKQRVMVSEIPEVNYIRYMTSHNSSNIHGENLHIWAVYIFYIIHIFRKLKYIFTKKLHRSYKNISGYKIWK